jgi:hypothetical protein
METHFKSLHNDFGLHYYNPFFMTVLEMKAKAFEKLAKINEESAIKEVLTFLEKLQASKEEFDVDSFFKNASEKYDDVLQKLAQ